MKIETSTVLIDDPTLGHAEYLVHNGIFHKYLLNK